MSLLFEIPLRPLSVNHYFGSKGTRRFITEKGREFKSQFHELLPKDLVKITGNVELCIHFNFKDRRKRDVDNYLKLLLDCLKNVVIDDDDQIYKLTVSKRIGTGKDNMIISVASYDQDKDNLVTKMNKLEIVTDKTI